MIRKFVIFGILVVLVLLAGRMSQAETTVQLDMTPAKPFDHSVCQYPSRTTNPVDGCDNSDPCDPGSAVKGGSGDCSDNFTQEEIQNLCDNGAGRCEDKNAPDDVPVTTRDGK